MGRLLGRLIVGLTLLLISFIAYSSQIFIIWPWYGREFSVELICLLLPFKCVSTPPKVLVLNEIAQFTGWNAALELLAFGAYESGSSTRFLGRSYSL
jgi:hypothetical protein